MRIQDWVVRRNKLCGYIVDSDLYPDDSYIETSEIVTAAADADTLLIRTANSVYECRISEYGGREKDLEEFLLKIAADSMVDSTRQITRPIEK
ncbi:MAG TPA: hypothetical protein DCM49_06660 [Lachnospiraceae bacterium]|nr:hypothetical protein [Lachnospiraceae bacterium]